MSGDTQRLVEVLAVLGHELRNPLSPILTALQLIKLRDPVRAEHACVVIERQVHHLIRLVDDLLDVARIARGKVELRTEVVELAEIVARAVEMSAPLVEERKHKLTVAVPRHGLAVDGDPDRLAQVVSNLINNAAKYTPAGGNVSVDAERLDGHICLHVIDDGIGIAPEVLPSVFELFVQEGRRRDESPGGLGLGLAIARNLIEQHGGTITANSRGRGRGSEFTVKLPAATAAPAKEPAATASEIPTTPARGLPRVLLVDDNEDNAIMLAMALRYQGFDVHVAHDGPTALQVAAAHAPDVAVLDIGLPLMSGYELASRLRALPQLGAVRVIAMTGYGNESERARALDAGFEQFLVKPVGVDAIEAAIKASGRWNASAQ